MKHYVYCYYKKKAGFFTQPVLNPYDTELIVDLTQRTFAANVGTPDHDAQSECDLYYLGQFEDVTGTFELLNHPEFLCSFVDKKVKKQKKVKVNVGKEDSISVQKS